MNDNTHKLLIVYAGKTTTADITIRLMRLFAERYEISVQCIENLKVKNCDIKWADTVLIIRGADYFLSQIMIAAKKAGKRCIFYLDDDLISLFDKKDVYYNFLIKCLKYTDILWVSNSNIIKKYSAFIRNDARTVEAVVLDPWQGVAEYKDNSEEIGILFAGSPAHEKMIKKYILPAMEKVYIKYPNIRFHLIGFKGTGLEKAAKYIETTGWFKDADEYRKYVSKLGLQIGLAIIEDSPFGRCKFYNKYLEYSKLGVMGIYTNCEPFTFAVKNGVNGLLADNTIEDWTEKIILAIEDNILRAECVKNAQNDLVEHYSTEAILDRIHEKIPDFTEYSAPNKNVYYSFFLSRVTSVIKRYLRYVLDPKLLVERLKGDKSIQMTISPNPSRIMIHPIKDSIKYGITIKKSGFAKIHLAFAKDENVEGECFIRIKSSSGEVIHEENISIKDTVLDGLTEIELPRYIDVSRDGSKYSLELDVDYKKNGIFGLFENKGIKTIFFRIINKIGFRFFGNNIVWHNET